MTVPCQVRVCGFAVGLAAWVATSPSWAAPAPIDAAERCQVLRKHGQNSEARGCFQALVRDSSAYLRAEGYWGLGEYSMANQEEARQQSPRTTFGGSDAHRRASTGVSEYRMLGRQSLLRLVERRSLRSGVPKRF